MQEQQEIHLLKVIDTLCQMYIKVDVSENLCMNKCLLMLKVKNSFDFIDRSVYKIQLKEGRKILRN